MADHEADVDAVNGTNMRQQGLKGLFMQEMTLLMLNLNGHGAFLQGPLLMLDCILPCRRLRAGYLADYFFQHILIRLGGVSALTYQMLAALEHLDCDGSHDVCVLFNFAKSARMAESENWLPQQPPQDHTDHWLTQARFITYILKSHVDM
nr:hypothetical protein [Tanacetum cinerariifolium]